MSKTRSKTAQRKFNVISCMARVVFLAFVSLVGVSQTSKAMAQTASFRSVDTNSDGVLSWNELTTAFGAAGARRLLEDIDGDGDNRITIIELRRGTDNGKDDRGDRGEREGGGTYDGKSGERDGGDDRGDDGDDGDDD